MIIKEGFLRDMGRLIVWFPLRWACSILPISLVLLFYQLMGDIHYLFGRRKRKELRENISLAFNGQLSSKEINHIVRHYLQNYYTHQLLIFLFPRLDKNYIQRMVTIEGLEHLDQALAQGKGCILVHGHFGLFQLPLFTLGLLGYRINQITLPSDQGLSYIGKKVAYNYRMRYEALIPARLIPANTFLRPVFTALKNNEVVMITGDGAGGSVYYGKYIFLNFFNHSYPFPSGPISLALKTGAAILPMFIFKEGFSRYRIMIGETLTLTRDQHSNSGLQEGMEKFGKLLENNIRKYPCHWRFWDEFSANASLTNTRHVRFGSNNLS